MLLPQVQWDAKADVYLDYQKKFFLTAMLKKYKNNL